MRLTLGLQGRIRHDKGCGPRVLKFGCKLEIMGILVQLVTKI
jgi:hypothetical protein